MTNWRDQILKEFTPKVARLTLVADPDGLLLEEGILEGIRERGFELIPFEDHIAFRYAYEAKFRSRWDRGEHTDLVVVLRTQGEALIELPFDLLLAGRKLSFTLGDIFPNLSYPVVAELDRGYFDSLYEAQKRYVPGQLGDNATKEFILRHVFEIAPELLKKPSDLLHSLLRRHYRSQRIPKAIDERLIDLLKQSNYFNEWPLYRLMTDREAFFDFLQERWPAFLDREANKTKSLIRENDQPENLNIEGPVDLPFEHHDIRVYIDNLFVEGLLHSVHHDHSEDLSKSWVRIGIKATSLEDRTRRFKKLLDIINVSIPEANSKYTDWFVFARSWAELIVLLYEQPETVAKEIYTQVDDLRLRVDISFTDWLFKRYAGLVNLPPSPPVLLHHLSRFLARKTEEDRKLKLALIVIDGLAMDQWLVIRAAIMSKRSDFKLREQAVFAWIPTITSVSRKTIFSGKAPIYFPNSIHNTEKEAYMWSQFWADQGYTNNQVFYSKGLGDEYPETVKEAIANPQTRIAGLVVDKIDKIMHGMELGTAGMHNQVEQWAKQPYIYSLFDLLFDNGFNIYLTSDHGNIEAEGCGQPAEGAVADLRGERVRVYPDIILRRKVKDKFQTAIEWDTIGLPEGYLALFAPPRKAFIQNGKRIVSHGGISVEEVIVPLINIERNAR